MRTLRIALAAVPCLLLAACQSLPWSPKPLFQATWYLIEDDPEKVDGLYVAVINQSGSAQFITGIVLNGSDDGASVPRWSLQPAQLPKQLLQPGEVLVRHQNAFGVLWGNCRIPVSVRLTVEGIDKAMEIKPLGNFPSAMPSNWRNCPQAP